MSTIKHFVLLFLQVKKEPYGCTPDELDSLSSRVDYLEKICKKVLKKKSTNKKSHAKEQMASIRDNLNKLKLSSLHNKLNLTDHQNKLNLTGHTPIKILKGGQMKNLVNITKVG